jgi:protein SCO1/2
VLVYFGFVTCPDICPTDLAEIGKALRSLGPSARDIQPIFITLDPPRDTQAILREYARAFHPRLIALTGSPEKIRAVAQAYKVFYEKVPVPGATEYTIDHTAFTYLIDREGKYVGIYPPGTHYDRLARMLRDEIAVATPGAGR